VRLPSSFDQGFRAVLGRAPSSYERGTFSKYLDLLLKWNSIHRLVGSSDPSWIVEHLFLDSLLFVGLLPHEVATVLDFGAGAGLPGIPIAIVRPEAEVTLLEARRRPASFLATAIRELGLTGARVLASRAEEIVAGPATLFDAVVMRCAGRLDKTFPVAAQLVKKGGVVVAAGPPQPVPLKMGRWVEIPGIQKGSTRRFAVLSR